MKEPIIVQKVLRSLLIIFDPNISSLEEREDLDTLSMENLHGILIAYGMRTKQENPSNKEATLKTSKRTNKKKKKKSNPNCNCSDESYEDEEMDNLIKMLMNGISKYKGMLPLKCFNCGGIGHFYSKCSYANI
jgi:hypothetical protein